jgi:farnesyl diphosphate synthase
MHDFTVFLARLREVETAVENLLDRLLSPSLLEEEVARPSRLLDAMRYATLSGGKRLRPFLVVETANALGTTGIEPLRVGSAIELVHCYSLIHDDLPALDSDDLRRGRPTVHKAFDEATAILAGDALLTYAFDVLSCSETHSDPEIRNTLCRGLARAAGIGGLAGGQMLDLEAERSAVRFDENAIRQLQAMKTGAILRFSVISGTLLAKASPQVTLNFEKYARAIGAAFQIGDDILDYEGDPATVGKSVGKDAAHNKATFVSLFGVEKAKATRDSLASEAEQAIIDSNIGASGNLLIDTARFIVERTR